MEKRKNEWYERNKDTEEYKKRVKENNKRYREKHREEINRKQNENSKKNREKYKEYYNEYSNNYYRENKEKWKEVYNNKDSFNCVYRFISKDGEILRIGSTGSLKMRIANYMSNGLNGIKLKEWFEDYELDKIEYILCSDRAIAYQVEYNLINKFYPVLNEKQILEFDIWDEYVEDLWQIYEGLDFYKCKYKAMLKEDL
jgi:hypothetical protein